MFNPRQQFNRYKNNERLPFRGELNILAGGPVQLAQVNGLAGETLQSLELYQQFGFTSGAPAGSQLIILPLGGQTAHSVIIATEHGAYRLEVQSGECRLYNQWGASIHLKQERIIEIDCDELVIKAKDKTSIATKALSLTAESINGSASQGIVLQAPSLAVGGSGGGSAQVSMTGNVITSGDVTAGGVSLQEHTHPEQGDGGGITGPPIP